jgi:2-methylcitrate synthase
MVSKKKIVAKPAAKTTGAPAVAPVFKPKKSVALSGVTAGNTALCTVGRSGNDLHYRGYDILDFADTSEFEEIAHLLIHGKLPNKAELTAYKAKLRSLRGLPAQLQTVLESLPAASHPMDVMRTAASTLGCILPEKDDHNIPDARDIADRLMANLGSALLYWYHYSHNGRVIDVQTDDDSIGAHFLHLLHGKKPNEDWVRAMHTSLILYAEHEFNASTFTCRVIAGTGSDMYSAISGGIGALRGPKHGGAKSPSKFRSATKRPMKQKQTFVRVSKTKKSLSVLATLSIRFPILATRSSKTLPCVYRRRQVRPRCMTSRIVSRV